MSAFKKHLAEAPNAPATTVRLPPSGFADTWKDKPHEPMEIGIKLLSEADIMQARTVAVRRVTKGHGDYSETRSDNERDVWIEAYNQVLMNWMIAKAACSPVDKGEPLWDMAEDVVSIRLSPGGTLRLFEEIESLIIKNSPLSPEIDAAGLQSLSHLGDGSLVARLPIKKQRYVRRLLARVLEICGQLEADEPERTGVVIDSRQQA